MKKTILLNFALLLAITAFASAATCSVPAECAPNEIIIKFHETVANTVETQLELKTSTRELSLSQSLDELNARYQVAEIKPVFKNFRARCQWIKALLGKDKTLLSKKEKHILRRLKRAAKGAKVPNLNRIYRIQVELEPGQSLEEVVAAYNSNPDVEYAELNYIVSINLTPNDALYPLQWALNNTGQMYPESGRFNHPPGTLDSDIDAPEAWNIHTGSSEIIVAVVDTGVDYHHRDLDDNMWVNSGEIAGNGVDDDENGYIDDVYGYDFINKDSDPKDDHGHGTHCSGIIAAEGDNGLDIAGVCWDGQIMALKFLDAGGSGSIINAVEAFYYATGNGADVISNSWSGGGYSQTLEEAIDYAHSQGVLMVASAGNDDSSLPSYPACYDHVIAVAATNSNDEKATFSNYGNWVDIAAPGVDILSLRAKGTSMGTTYDYYTTVASGTSMACPYVAGACVFLLSANPLLTCDEIYNTLIETVDPISPGICLSDGRINLFNAVLAVVPSKGRIMLDHDYYACSSIVSVFLVDYDLKGNGTQAVVLTTSDGDLETVLLTEIVSSAGVFTRTIFTAPGDANIEDGTLQVTHNQIITAVYEDANDGTANPATATDTAVVDCEEPMVFNVSIALPGREPRVSFETDEPTTARVLCGPTCGRDYTIEGSDLSLATNHTVKLTGVSPETNYFFIIEVTDAAGNETVDDNGGLCYMFTTTSPGAIYIPAQCSTMQEAIDNSWDGGIVWVADGTYTGPGNRDIDFKARAVIVRSENGPENCIIDCNGSESESHRGFCFHSGEDANSVLAGFTITNGYVSGSWYVGIGGAILCDNNSSPTITNCIITKNSAGWDGGGINNINSSPTITNCVFSENSAIGNDGGAINNEISSPKITNCTFRGNTAYDWGGAIRNIFYCSPTITNCTFAGNSADEGGAMFYYADCNPTITNCTFSGNSAPNGSALACDSLGVRNSIQITNSILADGSNEIRNNDYSIITITYSDVQGGWPGEGNIDADPCFAQLGYWADANDPNIVVEPNYPNVVWVEGNYHLLRTSPCIDAANDANLYTDIEGDSRPFDFPGVDNNGELPEFDMGAYEATAQQARLWILPRVINRKSRQLRIMAWLYLPHGITKDQVDKDVPLILHPGGIKAVRQFVFQNRRRCARRTSIFAFFDKAELMEAVETNGKVQLMVLGHLLKPGQYFYCSDTIRIKPRR